MISTLRNLDRGDANGGGDGNVGRRASIIHSADNQKSWKHTFMRRVVPEEQREKETDGERERSRRGWEREGDRTARGLQVVQVRDTASGTAAGNAEGEREGEPEIRMTTVELAP